MAFWEHLPPLGLAGLGTGFTFLMTALGAGMVFFLRGKTNESLQRVFLGFAAGVMIAASVWSLLIPAIELGAGQALPAWLPAAAGFMLGAAFLMLLDKIIPHLHPAGGEAEGPKTRLPASSLMVLAVTLHNIPEGMAVGLACAMAAQGGGSAPAAVALGVGMGLQNFPEGAAVALPLHKDGLSRHRAFAYGALSGIVEPAGGLLAVLVAGGIAPLMPWFLSFAAGAMLYVVVEELIPAAIVENNSHSGTVGALGGFVVMMVLDVALG